jgi:hypothetical protein
MEMLATTIKKCIYGGNKDRTQNKIAVGQSK